MPNKRYVEVLTNLFKQRFGSLPEEIAMLPASASYRRYYRLSLKDSSVIGTIGNDKTENEAFIYLTKHFKKLNLPVPEIYAENTNNDIYLQEDLGDVTLFQHLSQFNSEEKKLNEIKNIYPKVLSKLSDFQITGSKNLNYNYCFPRSAFDRQSIMWDLNYFKYNFLKFLKISFHEQRLEDDFNTLTDYLLQAPSEYFLFRDFQSRNIMLKNNKDIYFIDYQGGRKGALQYDVASVLYDGKVNMPSKLREQLLNRYADVIKEKIPDFSKKEFIEHYYGYALIRILQALGAYGFRGLHEGKPLFTTSIPTGAENLSEVFAKQSINLPEIARCVEQIKAHEYAQKQNAPENKLCVKIFSFSYKKEKPVDTTGHGGGFMFDCRFVENPGRYDEYKKLTGRDESVKEFLDKSSEMQNFLKNCFAIVESAIATYTRRNFNFLTVSFGCTGGQHRSVYSAEKLAEHLANNNSLFVKISHKEINDGKNAL